MSAPLSMEAFRSLERYEQVRALADAEFLGMAVTRHYAAPTHHRQRRIRSFFRAHYASPTSTMPMAPPRTGWPSRWPFAMGARSGGCGRRSRRD